MPQNSGKRIGEQLDLFGSSDVLDSQPAFCKWRETEHPPEAQDGGDDRDGTEPAGFIMPSMVDALVARFEQDKRACAESRPLPRSASLRALLKALPTPWLNALVTALRLQKRKCRAEREADAARHLQDPDLLRRVVEHSLTDRERRCLRFLLDRGGEEKVSVVARRFGTDENDGWFWEERPPSSVLGRLRQHGLVYVGVRRKGGRRYRTATIPDELQGPLSRLTSGR